MRNSSSTAKLTMGQVKFMERETKKVIEKAAVWHFLKNEGINPNESDIVSEKENEPIDIVYKGMFFQVTTAPAEVQEVVGRLNKEKEVKSGNAEGEWVKYGQIRTKFWTLGHNLKESWQIFIINPIENKRKKYGTKSVPTALKNIILLIFCYNNPIPNWKEELIKDFRKDKFEYFKSTGFKSIYLLDQVNNIKIYP